MTPPLLIVGHGTRSDAGVAEFTRLVGLVRDHAAGRVPADVLEARIDAALAGAPRRDAHVVLAGRGSTGPDANAEIAKVARLLWEGRGYAAVEFCFISLAEPSVPAALERAVRLGARRV